VADIHIVRNHKLGLEPARAIALRWAEQAEENLDMQCVYEEGGTEDEVTFKRPGAEGSLHVTASRFELNARLGFLLGAFKGRIEAEIVKNLDEMLAAPPATKPKPLAKKATAKKTSARR
jgi:putative polyhydroxyalkanoate system protein